MPHTYSQAHAAEQRYTEIVFLSAMLCCHSTIVRLPEQVDCSVRRCLRSPCVFVSVVFNLVIIPSSHLLRAIYILYMDKLTMPHKVPRLPFTDVALFPCHREDNSVWRTGHPLRRATLAIIFGVSRALAHGCHCALPNC